MSSMSRTVCDCDKCKECCKRQPGPLAPNDFERITKFLGQTPEQSKMLFIASDGCIARMRGGRVVRIGTITPARNANTGRCVFLDKNDHCMIHPVAPFGCAYFDPHMDKEEADKRSAYLAIRQTDRKYQDLRRELKELKRKE